MIDMLNQKQNRREFFRSLGRYMILGGLLGTTGTLVMKTKSAPAGNPDSVSTCQKCSFLRKCEQPDAVLARSRMSG